MSEYIIVVALIAISAIGVTTVFGQNLRILFGGAAESIGGDTNVTVNPVRPSSSQVGPKNLKNAFKNGQ